MAESSIDPNVLDTECVIWEGYLAILKTSRTLSTVWDAGMRIQGKPR
jgi:hypothetical protein